MLLVIISAVLTSYCLLLLVRGQKKIIKKKSKPCCGTQADSNMYILHAALCPLSTCPSRAARPTLAAQGRIPVVRGIICWGTLIGVSFAFPLNTGAVGLWRVIHYFRGHGYQHPVAKRMADCSSLAAGRLSLGPSLGGGVFDTYPLAFPWVSAAFLAGHGSVSAVWRRGSVDSFEPIRL